MCGEVKGMELKVGLYSGMFIHVIKQTSQTTFYQILSLIQFVLCNQFCHDFLLPSCSENTEEKSVYDRKNLIIEQVNWLKSEQITELKSVR